MKGIKPYIVVIGLGYVGLPLLEAFGEVYKNVVGYDISKHRLNYIRDSFAQKGFAPNFIMTNCIDEIRNSDFYIVTVPTPIDSNNNPNLQPLKTACQDISSIITKGSTVIFESTVYPGITEEYCIPIIEYGSTLKSNLDFFYGYSPERINIGDSMHSLLNTTKIVSGSTPKVVERIKNLYDSILETPTVIAVDIKTAEAAKLMENVQRDVLIAFANEYSIFCEKQGIDINDVIECAMTKWNFTPVMPGLVGGHCISVDPYYMIAKSEEIGLSLKLSVSARKVNEAMPAFYMDMILKVAQRNQIPFESAILLLGYSYKPNTDDIRNTKVEKLLLSLRNSFQEVACYDPFVTAEGVQQSLKDLPVKHFHMIIEVVSHNVFNDFPHSEFGVDNYLFYKLNDLFS